MANDRIEQLRTVKFPTERRGGYDRAAVDRYLGQIADWLETGGEDEARRELVQRELERVGERTAAILATAEESAENVRSEAAAEAERLRTEAERETAEQRSSADSYATETRNAADEHARKVQEDAAAESQRVREEAGAHAESAREQATALVRDAESEAAERTRGIEEEIAGLVRKRRQVIANLERLSAELKLAIEGPGKQDLELPERLAGVDQEAEALEPEDAGSAEPPTATLGVAEEEPSGEEGEGEPATAVYDREQDAEEAVGAPIAEDGTGSDEMQGGDDDDLDDERERARRRRAYDSVEQPTEDNNLTELL